jgi:hypothetical protein
MGSTRAGADRHCELDPVRSVTDIHRLTPSVVTDRRQFPRVFLDELTNGEPRRFEWFKDNRQCLHPSTATP